MEHTVSLSYSPHVVAYDFKLSVNQYITKRSLMLIKCKAESYRPTLHIKPLILGQSKVFQRQTNGIAKNRIL
jgi:hypothetical protein